MDVEGAAESALVSFFRGGLAFVYIFVALRTFLQRNDQFSRSLFHLFRTIACPVHARALAQQNGLAPQIVAALVRPQEPQEWQ